MKEIFLIGVPLAPLAATAVIVLFGGRLPARGGWVLVGGTVLSMGLLLALGGASVSVEAFWFRTGGIDVSAGLVLDGLSRFMAFLVAGVSLLVNLYAVGYMAASEARPQFYAALSFFAGAMLTLVLTDSFVLFFAAWEGVGLASFFLIGFRYKEAEAARAAGRAFLMTRLGDVGLLLGWLLAVHLVGSADISAFVEAVKGGALPETTLTLLAVLFLAGAIGKSAQLPLSAWLPPAMAGPTPVSALIHSATRGAAGVYLILRLFDLFSAAPAGTAMLLWIGGLTALFAGLVATTRYDLKRVLAWSTVSQLGEMVFALGLGGPLAAAYHLATHAAFKSTLFLTAGAVEHGAGSRDLRDLGGLLRTMPVTAAVFALAALALAGIPPLSGFWSEDKILADAVAKGPGLGILMILLIGLAGIYIARAGTAVFWGWPGAPRPRGREPHWTMGAGMIGLAIAAAALGWILHGSMASILPFPSGHKLTIAWKLGAVAAAVAGLGFGAWRVIAAGPVPALGKGLSVLSRGLETVTLAPHRAVLKLGRLSDRTERGLAGSVALLRDGVLAVSGAGDRMERGFAGSVALLRDGVLALSRAGNRAEKGFDGAARGAASAALITARASDHTERRGFSDGLDAAAGSLARSGSLLRTLQTGKLYHYTFVLSLWVILVSAVGLLLAVR